MKIPKAPKIYHIVHKDRLKSIIQDGFLYCDKEMQSRTNTGTTIGISKLKERRLTANLQSHEGLCVGACVPFYFCPRSIMLFIIYRGNHPDLSYQDGQNNILHLECDLHKTILWAESENLRWAFTTSNAANSYFDDYATLKDLNKINWEAVETNQWSGVGIDASVKDGKQAEFLIESVLPWKLVERVGIIGGENRAKNIRALLETASHVPELIVRHDWYY